MPAGGGRWSAAGRGRSVTGRFVASVLTLALILVPFIPGLRSIPRWIPFYRLIWRDYYRQVERRR